MSNFNYNKTELAGRLTAAPELKQTGNGISVIQFSLAVNRKYVKDGSEQTADFINCVAWRNTAEFIAKYFKKGSNIFVVGSLQTRSWSDDAGKKHYATEVVVDEAYFVEQKGGAVASQDNDATDDDLPY